MPRIKKIKIELKKFKKYNIINSFKNAIIGLIFGVITEPSAKIQLFLVFILITINLFFGNYVFLMIHMVFGLIVLSQEIMNTSIEYICDLVSMEYNDKIKNIKDLSAGSVFLLSFCWGLIILFNIITSYHKLW
jgi:diacylglycerol kinase (ATP)